MAGLRSRRPDIPAQASQAAQTRTQLSSARIAVLGLLSGLWLLGAAWRVHALRRVVRGGDRAWLVAPATGAALSIPPFVLLGLALRLARLEREPLVVQELFGASGRARVTRVLDVRADDASGGVALPGWPARVQWDPGASPWATMERRGVRFVLGEHPRLEGLRPGAGRSIPVEVVEWDDADESLPVVDDVLTNGTPWTLDAVLAIRGGQVSRAAGPLAPRGTATLASWWGTPHPAARDLLDDLNTWMAASSVVPDVVLAARGGRSALLDAPRIDLVVAAWGEDAP